MILPTDPTAVYMVRQELGWSIFYTDTMNGLVCLYDGIRLREAAAVCEEFFGTHQITHATLPKKYKAPDVSVPQQALLKLLRKGPRYIVASKTLPHMKEGHVWAVASVRDALVEKGLIRKLATGRYERVPQENGRSSA